MDASLSHPVRLRRQANRTHCGLRTLSVGDFGGNDSNGSQSVKLTGPSRFAIGYATRRGRLHSVNGSSSPHASVRSIGPDKRACGHSRLDSRIVGKQELTWTAPERQPPISPFLPGYSCQESDCPIGLEESVGESALQNTYCMKLKYVSK